MKLDLTPAALPPAPSHLDRGGYEQAYSHCVRAYLDTSLPNAERRAVLDRAEILRTRFAARFGAAEERRIWSRVLERYAAVPARDTAA